MQTGEDIRRSLEARIDDLDRQMDQIAERKARTSREDEAGLQSLRTRLGELRTRLRKDDEANQESQDEALSDIGHAVNDMSAEVSDWVK